VVQVIAVVQTPFTRVCPAAQTHFPALNVKEAAQVVQDPDTAVQVVQFPGQGLQTLFVKYSVEAHGVHQPVELEGPLQTHFPPMNYWLFAQRLQVVVLVQVVQLAKQLTQDTPLKKVPAAHVVQSVFAEFKGPLVQVQSLLVVL